MRWVSRYTANLTASASTSPPSWVTRPITAPCGTGQARLRHRSSRTLTMPPSGRQCGRHRDWGVVAPACCSRAHRGPSFALSHRWRHDRSDRQARFRGVVPRPATTTCVPGGGCSRSVIPRPLSAITGVSDLWRRGDTRPPSSRTLTQSVPHFRGACPPFGPHPRAAGRSGTALPPSKNRRRRCGRCRLAAP